MAIQHYEGKLGTFIYNDEIFSVRFVRLSFRGKTYEDEALVYIGSETDGAKIEIPYGIINCRFMFIDCDIMIAPTIPDTVRICENMFLRCRQLKTARVPVSVKDCREMFWGCQSLVDFDFVEAQEESVVQDCQGMFANCFSLKTISFIPDSVEVCTAMFENCRSLANVPNFPKNVKYCRWMFASCVSLTSAPAILATDKDIGCGEMFIGCRNLETISFVSPLIFDRVDMFLGCDKLDLIKTKPQKHMVHYNGELGEFDYDSTQFQVQWRYYTKDGSAYFYSDKQLPEYSGSKEVLRYIGWETDGSKIEIPEGIIDCSHMFDRCGLVVPPHIPIGVKNCSSMFAGCRNLLLAPVIPDTVEFCNYMFWSCTHLKTAPIIPLSVKSCREMFHCSELNSVPFVPADADAYNIFEYCENILAELSYDARR